MIYLVFTDDWELWGDASGDPEKLQFRPMRELVRIFNRHGVRASFYAEVMQQLCFRRFQDHHPELKVLADVWDEAVVEAFRQGHDIQLHLHPQWKGATYEGRRWKISAPWSLLDHDPVDVRQMLSEGKRYLQSLLRPIDPNYNCVAFRAGHWCIAPSRFALPTLAELGFTLDTSVIGGLQYRTIDVSLDYSSVEESLWPYYPSMDDARKVSTHPEPIVCVPTHHLEGQRFRYLKRDLKLLWQRFVRSDGLVQPGHETATHIVPLAVGKAKQIVRRYFIGETHISDISHLDYALLRAVVNNVRKRANQSGRQNVPVVLAGHSKEIRNLDDINRFVSEVSQISDVCCVTLTELNRKLADGTIPVRYAN